jgi:hypothetical protein
MGYFYATPLKPTKRIRISALLHSTDINDINDRSREAIVLDYRQHLEDLA